MFTRKFTTEFGVEIHISSEEDDWNTHRIYCAYGSSDIQISLLLLNRNASIEDAEAYMKEVAFVVKQAKQLRRKHA